MAAETSTEPATLREAVQQTVGHASMCWANVDGAGVFDDQQAARVVDELLAWIDGHNRRYPQLGYATTAHLIAELKSRTEMLRYHTAGPDDVDAPAMSPRMDRSFDRITRAHQRAGLLDYRTVDG